MWKVGVYIAVSSVVIGAIIAAVANFIVIELKKKKKKQSLSKDEYLELEQLSSSVRTASEKKVSFAGSQDAGDGRIVDCVTPQSPQGGAGVIHHRGAEKATADFNLSTHIEGNVYHGRLNGKNMAIRGTRTENMSKVETNSLLMQLIRTRT